MTAVLPYPTIERRRLNPEVPAAMLADADGSATVRLSPFHVPLSISLEIDPDLDSCTYVFSYANDEPAERTPTALPGDTDVLLALGKNSGKVLSVTFMNARERLASGRWTFDARRLFDLNAGECGVKRNPELIQRLIEGTPPSLLRAIGKKLRLP